MDAVDRRSSTLQEDSNDDHTFYNPHRLRKLLNDTRPPTESGTSTSIPRMILPSIAPFYEDVRAQLGSTDHFGLLTLSLEPEGQRTSRLEYAERQCALLLRVKQEVPWLGLGSKSLFPGASSKSENPWKSLQGMTGLEICQAWTFLLNAGHLFGTFATERALLFELDRTLEYREEFVTAASQFDPESGQPLRRYMEAALDTANLHRFFYLLSLWRLREGGPTTLRETALNQARLLVKAFLLPPPRIRGLVDLFRRVRSLSFLALHAKLGKSPLVLSDLTQLNLATYFPVDALPQADWASAARWDVVEAVNRSDEEVLFSNPDAASLMLTHAREFLTWWNHDDTQTFASRVDHLFSAPADWPSAATPSLRHFVELRLPSSTSWLHEVRHWKRDDQEHNPWAESNFLVAPSVVDSLLRVHLYAPHDGFATGALRHVITQLTRSYSGTAEARQQHALWMSTARLIARSFESTLKSGFRLRLKPVEAITGHAGYAIAGATYEFVRAHAKSFLPLAAAGEAQRTKELRQLLSIADEVVGWRSPTMLMLARTEVLDEAGTGVRTELDGLVGFFVDDQLYWLIVETKHGGARNGAKQLREKLFPAITEAGEFEIREARHGAERAWYVVVRSPQLLAMRI